MFSKGTCWSFTCSETALALQRLGGQLAGQFHARPVRHQPGGRRPGFRVFFVEWNEYLHLDSCVWPRADVSGWGAVWVGQEAPGCLNCGEMMLM